MNAIEKDKYAMNKRALLADCSAEPKGAGRCWRIRGLQLFSAACAVFAGGLRSFVVLWLHRWAGCCYMAAG